MLVMKDLATTLVVRNDTSRIQTRRNVVFPTSPVRSSTGDDVAVNDLLSISAIQKFRPKYLILARCFLYVD
jgi:hypothetical protein